MKIWVIYTETCNILYLKNKEYPFLLRLSFSLLKIERYIRNIYKLINSNIHSKNILISNILLISKILIENSYIKFKTNN